MEMCLQKLRLLEQGDTWGAAEAREPFMGR